MSLVVLGPRILLERVVEGAGAVYTGVKAVQEYIVRGVGSGVSKSYEGVEVGDRVLVRASPGREVQIPGQVPLLLVDEEDVLAHKRERRVY